MLLLNIHIALIFIYFLQKIDVFCSYDSKGKRMAAMFGFALENSLSFLNIESANSSRN